MLCKRALSYPLPKYFCTNKKDEFKLKPKAQSNLNDEIQSYLEKNLHDSSKLRQTFLSKNFLKRGIRLRLLQDPLADKEEEYVLLYESDPSSDILQNRSLRRSVFLGTFINDLIFFSVDKVAFSANYVGYTACYLTNLFSLIYCCWLSLNNQSEVLKLEFFSTEKQVKLTVFNIFRGPVELSFPLAQLAYFPATKPLQKYDLLINNATGSSYKFYNANGFKATSKFEKLFGDTVKF